jgi:hypothetical protein
MQHTVAMAIRTVGAQICRRLDVLIEAAGKPPVVDIEGTRAPRRPLAPSALAAERAAVPAPAVTPPVPKKRGRGRPPKTQTQSSSKKVAADSDSSPVADSSSDNEETPGNTADVKNQSFIFVFVFIDTWQVFYCAEHKLYSLVHGEKEFMKEIHVRSEMLEFDVTEQELAAAKTGVAKCICFPWVRLLLFL